MFQRREEDAVVRAQRALASGDPDDPLLRAQLAHAYFASNRDEAALAEYLWCLDELKGDMPQYAAEGARVLANLTRLAQRNETAMDALIARREAAEARLRNGLPESSDALFVTMVNLGLEDEAATLALYESVKDGGLPALDIATLRREVLRILVKNKRYGEVVAEFDVAARVAKDFDDYEWFKSVSIDPEGVLAGLDEWTREQFAKVQAESGDTVEGFLGRARAEDLRGSIARSYEILIGTGQREEASKIAARLVAALDDAKTRNALASAGYRSGSPVEESLVYAREAFEMTGGDNLHVVDTLARLLAGFKRRDEAIAVAETGLEKAETPAERELMNACLEYCRKQPAG